MALPKPQLNGDVLAYDETQTDALNNLQDIISNLVLSINPIGTIYESTEPTNPSSFIGGVWEEYGRGRVTVAVDTGQTIFNSPSKIGGSNTHELTVEEMPEHRHGFKQGSGHTGSVNDAYKNLWIYGDGLGGTTAQTLTTDGNQGVQNTGGGASHNNLQPYITVYRFRRIA